MRKLLLLTAVLISLTCTASIIDDSNAVLRASQLIRINHLSTESLSISEYGTVGLVTLEKFTRKDGQVELAMTYMGPADICSYTVLVAGIEAKIKSTDCAE